MTTERFTNPQMKLVAFLFSALIFMIPQFVNAQCTVSLENDNEINLCKHERLPLNSIKLTDFEKPLIMWKVAGEEHIVAFDNPGSESPILYGINKGQVKVSVSVRELSTSGKCVGKVFDSNNDIKVNISPKPEAVVAIVRSGERDLHPGDKLILEGRGENIDTHSWTVEPSSENLFSKTNTSATTFTAPPVVGKKTYLITYTGTNEFGCEEQSQITVTVSSN